LQYSANVHAIDNRGSTSLFYGLLSSHLGVVEILLSAGAEPNRRNFAGDTSFLLACANGHELIVDACLQYVIMCSIENMISLCVFRVPIHLQKHQQVRVLFRWQLQIVMMEL
jgi:ankyrin repeat protein